MSEERKLRGERIQIYFDCICGTICSIITIISLIITFINQRILNYTIFVISIVFFTSWLSLSVFIIFLGIYTWHKAKYFDETKQRKDLRPPII